jgi:hypothetical protein
MKTYKHTGTLPIVVAGREHEVQPGDTFEATLPLEQEAFLLKAGAIQIVEA